MGFYQERVLPHLVHATMRLETFTPYRRRIVGGAEGVVLEIGIGSGLNLALYGPLTTRVIGLDPAPRLLSRARAASAGRPFPVELLEGSAEAIPLDRASIDTVVTTWTLCSIPVLDCALAEVRRVLKPSGRLRFVEHGRAPDAAVARWQERLTPVWKRLAGGCHLNRAIPAAIEASGFEVERIETGYLDGPRPWSFMYEGSARVRLRG